jgi:hypothetical protein
MSRDVTDCYSALTSLRDIMTESLHLVRTNLNGHIGFNDYMHYGVLSSSSTAIIS